MKRVTKDIYEPHNFDMEVLQSYIESFLSENPDTLNLKKIIESSIKKVTGCTSCVHCKKKDKNPNTNISIDDPLYTKLVEFVQNSTIYQANLEAGKSKNEQRAQRKKVAQEAKIKEKALDDFFVHAHLNAKNKSNLKHK